MKVLSTKNLLALIVLVFFSSFSPMKAQEHTIAREWNEMLLNAIRNDFARPTVHARNLFQISAAMYDAWAAYDDVAKPYFLGNNVNGQFIPFNGVPTPDDIDAARQEAISYAAYRLISYRFQTSPGAGEIMPAINVLFFNLGYNFQYTNIDYASGNPADLGNYIAFQVIAYGNQDGSNEQTNYSNQYYEPVNPPLSTDNPGNPDIIDPNRWQPLTLEVFIDQSGNEIPGATPPFLSPEWGNVKSFALKTEDLTVAQRDGHDWNLYHNPAGPPLLDTLNADTLLSDYKWGFSLVSAWAAHLDPSDSIMWDISPATIGNIGVENYPTDLAGLRDFYDFENGGDISQGHTMNPYTGAPYEPNIVPRGDYARVLAEFWADGPDSETPPGHWFTILNYVNDHPALVKKYRGQGDVMDDLEWDVKSYFMLGGAMHDAAVTTWGIKGYYDYIRPVSAIRLMGDYGQCTDTLGSNYHPAGLPLIPNRIDTITANDPIELKGTQNEHVGKVKLYTWRGPDFIENAATTVAGVGWIRSENWWPYQRPTFITPNFAGYVSGHSTYSSAAAQVLEMLTGDAFFPGGMGSFNTTQNEFLVFEDGPSQDVILQWATYRDASDQTSLSRIWGGIHPPADDIPGRIIGIDIGKDVVDKAENYFFIDADQDGFFSFEDCDDTNSAINPDAIEICDGIDNNCDGMIDNDLTIFTYYVDADADGFGSAATSLDTCATAAPIGFANNDLDCNDNDASINPNAIEICDGIDNNCDGMVDNDLTIYTYYIDADEDGFGSSDVSLETCNNAAPTGYVDNADDCNDNDASINPDATEICDDIDNNCNGMVDDGLTIYTYYADFDMDGFGISTLTLETCNEVAPANYVDNADDCDDTNPDINPDAVEIPNNDIDENCDGIIETSINSIDGNVFSMFPNPAQDYLNLSFNEQANLQATVYAITGQRIASYQVNGNSLNIPLNDFTEGVYLLELSSNDKPSKVVKRFEIVR